jgi:hypothetical protein
VLREIVERNAAAKHIMGIGVDRYKPVIVCTVARERDDYEIIW